MPLPADNNLLSVSKASSLLEVSSDTLRRLDKKGQVTPKRGPNGERLYSADDISLLKQILKKPAGERSYGIQEAANILSVSPQTIRRWEREGKIATSRTPGGTRFFTLKDIQALQNLPRTVQTQTPVTTPQMPVPTLQIPTPAPQMPTPPPIYEQNLPEYTPPFAFKPNIPETNNVAVANVYKKRTNYVPYIIIALLIMLLGGTVAFIGSRTFFKSTASNTIETNLPVTNPTANPPVTNNPIRQITNTISSVFKLGSIMFQGADGQLTEDNNNLFWDAANAFLGIGTNLPNARLTVSGGVTGAALVELIGQASNNILSATSDGQQVFNIDHAGNTQIAGAISDINDSSLNVLENLAVGGDLTVAGGDITSSNDLRIYSTTSTTLGSSLSPTTINGKDVTFKNSVLTNSIKLSNTATALPNGNTGIVDAIVDAYNHGGSSGDDWSSASSVVYPNGTTDNLAIGGTTSSSPFYVAASSGNITTSGNIVVNGNATLGNAITDSLTFSGRVAQDSSLIPIGTTGTNNLGSASLPWDNVYSVAMYQNGNLVCDVSGTNCPGGIVSYWGQTAGALYPVNSSADFLIGADSTASAKFAFTGVNSGTPNININNVSVLNATTLGSGVTGSSLTSVGALASGSIASGFGTISTGNTITGTVINGTTSLNTGAGAGTARIDVSGNLTAIGTTQINGVTYTWPGADGTGVLTSNGSGGLSWAAVSAGGQWTLGTDGILYPNSQTADVLIGGTATASARFAFTNVNSGTPTATIAGTTTNVATYLTGNGNLATTNMAHLIIGGGTTGGVDFGSTITSGTWNGSTIATNYGGTGFSSYAVGDMLYADTTSTLAKLADVAVGNVLISGGIGMAPNWNKVTLGTHTTGNYVATLTGTANQITASASTGDITLSVPSDFRAPGIVNAVTGVNTGATAGTQRIDASGNLTNIGTTQFNTVTYTWPASISSNNYVLQTQTDGTLAWVDPAAAIASNIYWTSANGALFPKNSSLDVLIGSDSTASAKFAFTNVNSGTPTASISGATAGVATYLTGNGNLATTNAQNLTLGGTYTGNVIINSRGSTALTANGANLTGAGTYTFPNANTLTGAASYLQNSQGFSVGGGTTYYFDGSGNLNANTLATGGTQRIDASGNLTNIGTTQINGTTYTWPASATAGYVLQSDNTGAASTLSWVDPVAVIASNIYWTQANGVLFPKNNSVDVLIGSDSTTSAKFAFTGVNGGLPTASISGSLANIATYITGNGNLQVTNMADLTLGGGTTGRVVSASPFVAGSITDTGLTISKGVFTDTNNKLTSTGILGTGQGGTGLNSYTTGDLIYANAPNTLTQLADVATGNVLISGGVGIAPSWDKVILGTHTTGNYVATISGTVNQINVAFAGNNATLSIPSDFRAPGTINAVNGLYTGAVAGTQRIDAFGNLINIADISASGYATISGSLALGNTTAGIGPGHLNISGNLVAGGNITGAVLNGTTEVNTGAGTGTARIDASGNLTNIGTTQFNTVTYTWPASISSNNYVLQTQTDGTLAWVDPAAAIASGIYWTSANGALFPKNNSLDVLIGADSTSSAKFAFTGVNSGTPNININNVSVLNATTLGTGVLTSSLTTVGALTSGSIASGFGTISTANTITGTTIYQGVNQVCDAGGTGCPAGALLWAQTAGAIYPVNNTVDLLIGSNATASAKFAFINVLTGIPTASISGSVAGNAVYLTGDGTLATTLNRPLILNPTGGNVGIGTTAPNAALQVGTGSNTHTMGAGDAFITSDLELDGILYLDGGQIANSAGTASILLSSTPTTTPNTLSAGSWLIENTANVGQAALMVNQLKDGDIFTASASGVTKFTIANNGNISLSGNIVSSGGSKYLPIFYEGQAQINDTFFDGFTFGKTVIITRVTLSAKTAPTGSDLTVDLTKNGSTQSRTATLAAGANSQSTDITDINYTSTDTFGLKVTGIGSTEAGRDMTVIIHYREQAGDDATSFIAIPYEGSAVTNDIAFDGFYPDAPITITKVSLAARNAPTGSAITVDLTKNGSIQSRTATLAAGSTYQQTDITDTPFSSGERLGVKVTGEGSTVPGEGITIILSYTHDRGDTGAQYLPILYAGIAQNADDILAGWPLDESATITSANLFVRTAPAGANLTVDLTKNGSVESRTMTLAAGATYQQTNIIDDTYTTSDTLGLRITGIGSTLTEGESVVTVLHTSQGGSGGGGFAQNRTMDGQLVIGSGDYSTLNGFSLSDGSAYISGNLGVSGIAYLEGGTLWTSADLAENYPAGEAGLAAGEVVSLAIPETATNSATPTATASGIIYRARAPYDPKLLGIISTKPAGILSGNTADYGYGVKPVALVGRVPVKIDPDSEPITAGDFLTSSDKPGLAKKATQAGYTVGKALESWQFGEPNIIDIFVNLGYYDPNIYLTDTGDLNIVTTQISDLNSPTSTPSSVFSLQTSAGEVINRIGAFANIIAANIKAGAVIASQITTDEFMAFQGTIDNLLIKSGLVTPNLQVALISPLSDSTDVTIQVGSEATPSGKFVIQNSQGTEVASIDSSGSAAFTNATISGELFASNIHSLTIDQIQEQLRQVKTDQDLLTEAANWNVNTASSSAVQQFNSLAATDLYVTNQGAFNSLSVSNAVTIGSDLVFQSQITDHGSPFTSIDTLTAPLKIQSLALAPLEIMAGLVTIDTHGNVNIAGNLFVAGRIHSSGLTLKESLQLTDYRLQNATESASLLSLQNNQGAVVASVDASGSAMFTNIQTQRITGSDEDRGSVEILPAEDSKVVQRDWNSTPSAVLVSSSYKTQAWVTDISEKGFTIRVSDSLADSAGKLFWWALW